MSDPSGGALATTPPPTTTATRSIRIADSNPLSGLQRPTNNARGQSVASSLASSVVGGGEGSVEQQSSAPIIDATHVNSSSIISQQQQQQQQQSTRIASLSMGSGGSGVGSGVGSGSGVGGAPRIEGMEQLEKFQGNYANMTEAEKRMQEEELSFYSASDNDHGDDNIWGLLSGVGGNIYEWYDFAVYGLLAAEIGAAFFPQSSKELQLVNSFGVYLAAFVMRPIGAILFGEIGDRIVGRKHALVFSILLITIPSVLMGMLPGFDTWGYTAPILLVILRMLQGLSVGGQLAGSYVLSIEQSSAKNRGFRGSVCDASSVGGFLLASLVISCVRFSCTAEQVDQWAWRLPFLFSLLLAPILFHVVNQTEESKLWTERSDQKETEDHIREVEIGNNSRPAIFDLMASPFRRRQLSGMIGLLSSTTGTFYILFLWTPVYLSELKGYMTQAHADSMNVMIVTTYIVFLLLAGRASDSFPHRKDLMFIGLPGLIVACPVMFSMFESEQWWGFFIGQILLAACLAMVNGGMAAFEVELWMSDPTLSYTGVAVGHNMAATLFGGTMPLVATALYYKSVDLVNVDEMYPDFFNTLVPKMLPGLYISLLGMLSLCCIGCFVKHPHDVRTGGPQLQAAVKEENRKFKATLKAKAKKKRKKNMEQQLQNMNSGGHIDGGTSEYRPPTIT